jgi:hypothetical protein
VDIPFFNGTAAAPPNVDFYVRDDANLTLGAWFSPDRIATRRFVPSLDSERVIITCDVALAGLGSTFTLETGDNAVLVLNETSARSFKIETQTSFNISLTTLHYKAACYPVLCRT